MNDIVRNFIHEKQIDSFQKVSFLLFLYRYADHHQVSHEFARQLHFSADPLLEDLVNELSAVGLLQQVRGHYILPNVPEIRQGMDNLVRVYEDPLARQDLLIHLYRRRPAMLQ